MISGMKTWGNVAAIAALALLLAGCAAAEGPAPPVETPTVDANDSACASFVNVTFTLDTALQDESTKDDWTAIRDAMDGVALNAEGDVKARLETLVEEWPDYGTLLFGGGVEPFNDGLSSVARACEAAGHTTDYNYLTTSQ